MKAIGSSNTYYQVFVRGIDRPIRLSAEGGEKLSSYLTGENINQFVQITDQSRNSRVIRTSTIDRVEKCQPQSTGYKTVAELGLPELSIS